MYLFPLLLLLIVSCDKKTPDPGCKTVNESPQAFLDYFYFPEGSWWVYKLKGSNPAEYDTLKLTYRNKTYHQPAEAHGTEPCAYVYSTYLMHSNQTYFFGTGGNLRGGEELFAKSSAINKWYIEWSTHAGPIPSPGALFFYPYKVGEQLTSKGAIIAKEDTLITPLQAFPNTVTILAPGYSPTDSMSEDYLRRIYFSPKVGVVRADYSQNQIWELVNYHINR